MTEDIFAPLLARLRRVDPRRTAGEIVGLGAQGIDVAGLGRVAALGDAVELPGGRLGDIVSLSGDYARVMVDGPLAGLRLSERAFHLGPRRIAPSDAWVGRVIDPDGQPLDGRPLDPGDVARPLVAAPPSPTERRGLGAPLDTGLAVFDTLLPIVRGQRVGLFAGSGVGKSILLSSLARGIEADVVVIGLIGERGREVREFVEETLGEEGLKRAVVVAATSDRPALTRARAALTTMAVAEHFRDRGRHVLLLADSITRFAEAHREVAAVGGEAPVIGGFPSSLAQAVMGFCERAGPGCDGQGDITAIMTVLVAGSDMEGPVADILRGVLDGHVVLDRKIAERGRYPAVDLLRSVSRALPKAASADELALINKARRLLGAYDKVELMLQAGLYAEGKDPVSDAAVALWPALDSFLAEISTDRTAAFRALGSLIGEAAARAA
ncbi:FliI/YscN family ATPase [Rhodobacterales bacterium HKCCE2091]|nr:FliI/YscN family ATPase [Rhodobacterales bacterium HKCCE2091]